MINACVSHEMRNPLNSIIAQNIEKREVYLEMEQLALQFEKKELNKKTFL
jgi:signal transduction histidine kinase